MTPSESRQADDVRHYVVDRIEDGRWAVLEAIDVDEGTGAAPLTLPRGWIPGEAREGTVLRVEAAGDGVVRFDVDREGTRLRAESIAQRRARIPRGPGGDIEL